MKNSAIYCPGGRASQTGTAVKERYPGVEIAPCEGISEIPNLLDREYGPFAVPIWNSNQGEIKPAEYVWNLIVLDKIKIFDIWPKRIEFWYVVRTNVTKIHGVIGSVGVAKTQCSKFLELKNLKFEEYKLTTAAFDDFKLGALMDGVLVAPEQGADEKDYKVINKKTANSNNFTSFVQIAPSSFNNYSDEDVSSWLTGVSMASLSGKVLKDEQVTFFEQVFSCSENFENIPKLIFVFERVDRVGLLFEGEQFTSGDFLSSEELETDEIIVHENVGELKVTYTEELKTLFSKEFPDLKNDDFILHRGVNTVLFVCPELGMYTHGFAEKIVEPVVRYYISKIFEFIESGGKCSGSIIKFYKKYEKQWTEQRSKFINFKEV